MPQLRPVFIGNWTRKNGTDPNLTTPIIINVSEDVWVALGSPAFDSTLLSGTTQENLNGQFTYAKRGTRTGKSITLFTSDVTPKNYPKVFNIQYPPGAPIYLLDRYMDGLTSPPGNFTHIKVRGGRKVPIGSTVVT